MARGFGISMYIIVACLLSGWQDASRPSAFEIGQALSDKAYLFEQQGKWDSAAFYYQQTIDYAQRHNLPGLGGKNMRYLGLLYQIQAQYDSALIYFRKAQPFVAEAKDTVEQGKLINDMGNLLNYLGDFQGAIEQYLEASKRFEWLGQDSVNGVLFANIGYAFIELEDFAQAEYYNRKALHIAQRYGMESSIGVAYINLGSSLKGLKDNDSALFFNQQALVYGKKLADKTLEIRSLANLAGVEAEKKNYAGAISLIEEALSLVTRTDQQIAMEALMGKFLSEKGDLVLARKYLLQSLTMARETGLKEDEREALLHLSKLEKMQGRSKAANAYLEKYIALSDSLQNAAIHAQSQRMTILYETERKEKENQILKAENAEKVLALQAAQTRSRLNTLLLLLFASLFIGTAVIFAFYRKNADQKRKLAEQEADMHQQDLEQLRQTQQLQLMKAMLEGQENERNRLAKDLHDGLGGLIASISLQFDKVQKSVPILGQHQDYERTSSLLQKAGTELRQIAHNLMPANLVKFGLVTALEDFISEINFSNQIQIDFQYYGLENRLPDVYEISLYRIVQELVHNMIKHAAATEALVQIFREGNSLHLTVEDNGKGMDTTQLEQVSGHGLRNIDSRVKYLDGTLEIVSQAGEGTSFMIELELKDYDTASHRG